MSLDAEKLFALLPAVYRTRDHERGGPLRALLSVIAEQVAVLEDDLAQRYDDLFVETCAEWVVPYIGDLLGVRELHPVPGVPISHRAEVAHTIAYRRRKGTATMLEQLARDVTGLPARVVEFFELLSATQHVNHVRPGRGGTADLRAWEPLARTGSAFESLAHTGEVRSIAGGEGRFNIPSLGVFLWRLEAFPLQRASAARLDDHRFLLHPLGIDAPLFTQPRSEETITHLATPLDVPDPIRRRAMAERPGDYYGEGRSLLLWRGETPVGGEELVVCDLGDVPGGGGAWAHTAAAGEVRIDPERGRVDFGTTPAGEVSAALHHGFSHAMGGGGYAREVTAAEGTLARVPADHATIADALAALAGAGTVEVADDETRAETPSLSVERARSIVLRAADRRRPVIVLGGELVIDGGGDAQATLEGLVLAGARVRVAAGVRELHLRHCTLVPGLALARDGRPLSPDAASLVIESERTVVHVDHSIVGPILAHQDAEVRILDSIVDAAGDPSGLALGGLDGGPGAPLHVERSTIFGDVRARLIRLASNSILPGPMVEAQRLQEGCVRFSYVPLEARVPRRHRCQPTTEAPQVRPAFSADRYGHPAYGQLAARCDPRIAEGADDGAEMGAFHDVFLPQRLARLRLRYDEYLRFGLEAGVFFET
jgi:hypothetical protein